MKHVPHTPGRECLLCALEDEREAERLWRAYCATHTLPDGIPPNPDQVYDGEWLGWVDWISSTLRTRGS